MFGMFRLIRAGETAKYRLDWSEDAFLGTDTISSSRWIVGPSGPTLSNSSLSGSETSTKITGCSFGIQYTLTNIIVTSTGQIGVRSLQLRCGIGADTSPDAGGGNDSTPDQFTFVDITGALQSSAYTSNTIVVSGIDTQAQISIVGGTYSINGGSYTSADGTVQNGDTVAVRLISSAAFLTSVGVVLTIGGVSDTYSVTTAADSDSIPNSFSFTDKTDADLTTLYTSNTITVSGITVASPISITGGQYSVNGGAYTSSAGTVVNGDTVSVCGISANAYTTAINVVLTIGGVSDTYTITTIVDPASLFPDNASGASEYLIIF